MPSATSMPAQRCTRGKSIKALSEFLGHADPGFTLRTYTHLVEDSSQRTKRAIDTVFGHAPADDALVEMEAVLEEEGEQDLEEPDEDDSED